MMEFLSTLARPERYFGMEERSSYPAIGAVTSAAEVQTKGGPGS